MLKKLLLIFISTIFTFILCYAAFFSYNLLNLKELTKNTFIDSKTLNFHKKYSEKLHHLRGDKNSISERKNYLEYMYSVINDFENKKNKILLQGDSWAEQLNNKSRKNYQIANDYATDLVKKNNLGFINSGITSYSPSLMQLQLNILLQDFKIKPNIIVAIIDQSDIGDENCRYKKNKVFKNKSLIAVKKDAYTDRPLDFTYLYNISIISMNSKNKFSKAANISNFIISHTLKKNIIKFNSFLNEDSNARKSKCYWSEIAKYLESGTEKEINYFSLSLNDYISFVLDLKFVEKLYLVSFPHKRHLDNFSDQSKYTKNVSNIINSLKINSEKFVHLNFTKKINNNIIKVNQKSFYIDDPASHLSDRYYGNVFIKEIMRQVLKDIN